MRIQWVLVAIFAFAAFDAQAQMSKTFVPVQPDGPFFVEKARESAPESKGPERSVSTEDGVVFDRESRNFRTDALNQLRLDEE